MSPAPRKLEIISVASTLFKEKGYSAVTMRDIAKAMGIKAASLYNHIKNKEEILTFIIISLAEEFIEGLDMVKDSNANCKEKLKQIISLHVDITSRNTNGMASLNNDWMHLKDRLDDYLVVRVEYENTFRDIIKEGIKNNEIKNLNPDIMLFSILSTLRSLYIWIPQKEEMEPALLAFNLSEVLLKGINK
jgi:AcrR family transcriptional regulator